MTQLVDLKDGTRQSRGPHSQISRIRRGDHEAVIHGVEEALPEFFHFGLDCGRFDAVNVATRQFAVIVAPELNNAILTKTDWINFCYKWFSYNSKLCPINKAPVSSASLSNKSSTICFYLFPFDEFKFKLLGTVETNYWKYSDNQSARITYFIQIWFKLFHCQGVSRFLNDNLEFEISNKIERHCFEFENSFQMHTSIPRCVRLDQQCNEMMAICDAKIWHKFPVEDVSVIDDNLREK